MSEQQGQQTDDDNVPGGGLSGNEDGASSDGDTGPSGKGGGAGGKAGAPSDDEAREDEAQPG